MAGNAPLGPLAQSTPRRNKDNLICPHCQKVYRIKFYFDRHLETAHSLQSPGNVTTGDTTSLNVSDLSFNTSPFKKPAIPKTVRNKKAGNKNKVRAEPKKFKFRCTFCPNTYVSETVLRKHIRTHTMQVAAARFPDMDDIVSNAEDIGMKALTAVSNCPSYGPSGQLFRELLGYVVTVKNFSDFSTMVVHEIVSVERKKTILPSALIKILFGKMELVLSDDDFCAKCFSVLEITSNFSDNTKSQFLLEFLLCVTSEIFSYISTSFRSHYPRARRTMPELDQEDKQVIYYVAGSIMRGYLRMSVRYKKSVIWKDICAVLKSSVLCSKPVGDIDAEWTKKLDRGGLLYINTDCQKFFISLTKVIYQNEKSDGSIDYDLIIRLVTESETSVFWDNVFKDSFPEEVSVNFMNDVVSAFCKACGRGIARRRLNALRDKPVISMPTRHAVASRKK